VAKEELKDVVKGDKIDEGDYALMNDTFESSMPRCRKTV